MWRSNSSVSAATLPELTEKICSNLELSPSSDYALSVAGSEAAVADLEEVGDRAKLQVWPRSRFEPAEEAAETADDSEQPATDEDAAAAEAAAERVRQAEMMLEYDRQAAESVSLTNTAEMSVSIVSTDSETVFEVWVQQGETSWKMEKEWTDCD